VRRYSKVGGLVVYFVHFTQSVDTHAKGVIPNWLADLSNFYWGFFKDFVCFILIVLHLCVTFVAFVKSES